MSECNCCCCAYLSPPWWVTMGYGGYASSQSQQSTGVQPTPKSMVVPPPPTARAQTTPSGVSTAQATPAIQKPTLTKVVSDVARGDIVNFVSDVIEAL